MPRLPSAATTAAAPRRPRRLVVVALGLVLVAGAAGWVVGFTGVLGVRTVAVTGLQALPVEQVRAAAAVRPGEPLARVDTAAIADRVRTIPGVARAAVTRSWPATVRIAVTERRGVAVVAVAGTPWLVDGTGVRFQQLPAAPPGLPRLAVRDVSAADPATAAALAALAALGPAVRAQLLVVAAQTPDSVTLALRGGRTVLWGGAAESAAKAQVLVALLARPGTVYDVSTPSVVTVR
jgi:cell division protein FtsQ